VQRGKAVLLKPEARVRLFTLYGVAGASTSMRKWASSAPPWLEVRLLELPGHGYLADEPLPPCAARRTVPVAGAELQEQRAQWVRALADQLQLLVQGPTPYALCGFSFGALVVFDLCHELRRRNLPLPLLLVATGRGAPHAMTFSSARIADVQRYDDEEVLNYFAEAFGVKSERIAPSVRPRAASLFRCGALLGAVHSGGGCDTAAVPNLWDDVEVDVPHAPGVPRVHCPLLSLSGGLDTCWPPHLVERWRDVAAADAGGECVWGGYTHVNLEGTEHQALMNAPRAMEIVFDEISKHALAQASGGELDTSPPPPPPPPPPPSPPLSSP
jgi:alpha-beta hydrolase superfamily lysophospholipase